MARDRTESQIAAGKLISSIQKEWGLELGTPSADASERVMDLAHELLQAGSGQAMNAVLGELTLTQYLGDIWVARHPSVRPAIADLERALEQE